MALYSNFAQFYPKTCIFEQKSGVLFKMAFNQEWRSIGADTVVGGSFGRKSKKVRQYSKSCSWKGLGENLRKEGK